MPNPLAHAGDVRPPPHRQQSLQVHIQLHLQGLQFHVNHDLSPLGTGIPIGQISQGQGGGILPAALAAALGTRCHVSVHFPQYQLFNGFL